MFHIQNKVLRQMSSYQSLPQVYDPKTPDLCCFLFGQVIDLTTQKPDTQWLPCMTIREHCH